MARGSALAIARPLRALWDVGALGGISDGQLLDQFATGRGDSVSLAFQTLVDRHGPMVLMTCRRVLADPNDADDAFQSTFLVLLRRAGSIRARDSLASWLHAVATRVAARARVEKARRLRIEARGIPRSVEWDVCADRQELESLVHEELARLPDKYRAPIVLCYLEGLTHEAAANQLGWPVGTVRGRLSRARELLRARLTRRGVTATSALAAMHSLSQTAKSAVPAALREATAQAVIQSATDWASTAVASGRIAAWAARVPNVTGHSLWYKIAELLLLIGAFGTALGWLMGGARQPQQQPQVAASSTSVARNAYLRELQQLKGTWSLQVTRNPPVDKLLQPAKSSKQIWSIDRDVITTAGEDGFAEFTYRVTVDPSKTPKAVDMNNVNMGITLPGIYQIDGDTLTITYGYGPSGSRPTEFRAGPDQFQAVLRRESRLPARLAPEFANAPGCCWVVKPWDWTKGMLDDHANSLTGGGIQVITKQDAQGRALITMAYVARIDDHGPSVEYRPVAFDDKGARHVAERGLGGSSESPANLGTLLVMHEYRVNLPADRIKKFGIELVPSEVLRENERTASDRAFQEARDAGIEILPRPEVDRPYDFALTAGNGRILRSDALKGKVVLIDCWESRDGSYTARVPGLRTVYERFRGDGFEVIGLNFDSDRAIAERLVKDLVLPWPQVFVPAGDLRTLRLWSEGPGFPRYPRFLLLDRDGILRWDGASPEELSERISALIQARRTR